MAQSTLVAVGIIFVPFVCEGQPKTDHSKGKDSVVPPSHLGRLPRALVEDFGDVVQSQTKDGVVRFRKESIQHRPHVVPDEGADLVNAGKYNVQEAIMVVQADDLQRRSGPSSQTRSDSGKDEEFYVDVWSTGCGARVKGLNSSKRRTRCGDVVDGGQFHGTFGSTRGGVVGHDRILSSFCSGEDDGLVEDCVSANVLTVCLLPSIRPKEFEELWVGEFTGVWSLLPQRFPEEGWFRGGIVEATSSRVDEDTSRDHVARVFEAEDRVQGVGSSSEGCRQNERVCIRRGWKPMRPMSRSEVRLCAPGRIETTSKDSACSRLVRTLRI